MARLRIAGSHLNNLMGMEVRGMPLTSFITPNGRREMGDMLEEVFQRPSVCELRLSAEVGRNKPAMDARMLLLPLKSDLGDVSRVLGCFVARGQMGNQPRRFDVVGTKIRPLTNKTADASRHLEAASDNETIKGFREPQADYTSTSKRPRKPYLRLIKNDD